MSVTRTLCWRVVDDDTEREQHQWLDNGEETTITTALRLAADKYHEHCSEIEKVKAALEDGESVAMWAPGESGVRAAQRLMDQFHQQENDARKLLAKLDGENET